ncbi:MULTISPECIES: MATE family efflux transporter [Roseobacteraceae]|uniref:MATE family efflux transporter n=1 Tax=Roseobacteraceae TaxID=2854170 RepID=UPI0013B90F16|nr:MULTISPECIES: MATE family efflux transporter [Roseobacteraceae]MCA0995786.1 MATE family efflux transporter [Alloyangia pacifica]NDV98692.1 MATE family efflux transporter [Salipiger sp. PrR002]NDW57529.1 MATE family efflux transporter [Salipiger sp. PrR004]
MTQDLPYSAHIRAVLVMGLPLIGGHLAQLTIGLTDTVMMGRYGVPELAALTLSMTLFQVLFLFGSGFAFAVMPMVAQYAARGDEVHVRRVARMGLWLSAAFFLLALPILWFSGPLLRLLGQDDIVAANAQTYLRIAGCGLLPALGVMVFKSYLAALEHTRAVLWITVAAALVNAAANYALIFGNWGAPELGIRGAAIASICAHSASFFGVILYARLRLPEHQIWFHFWRPDMEMLREVFQLGWPIGLTTLAEVGLFAATAVLVGWLGTLPLAAHGIAMQLSGAIFMIHLGFSNVATVRAGQAMGRSDLPFLTRGAMAAQILSIGTVILTVILFLGMPETLIDLFLSDDEPRRAEILRLGTLLLLLAAVFQLVDSIQVIVLGVLRGLQDTKVPMIIAAVSYWLIGLPAAYVLGFPLGYGAGGVWMGLSLGLGVAALLLYWRFWYRQVPHLSGLALARGAGGD